MRDKNRIYCLFLGILWICQLSSGIIIPNQELPRPQYTSGIKTTIRKNTNPYMVQNYSRVVVHNRPDVSGAQYVVTHTTDDQHVYPVYILQHKNQRTQHQNILQTQSHTQIDAGQFSRPNKTIIKRKIESKTLEIYTKCPPGATGQFIYSASCNQYLNCWKGRGNVQNCAPGTLFNPKSLECDFPDKVECVTGPTANTIENVRVQKSILQASCPAGFSGIIPDYFDCSKFINCDNGQENKMACAPGTLFDMNKNMCDYPQSTTCFNGDNSLEIKSTATQEQYQWNHDSNAGKYGKYRDDNYVGQETIPSYTYCNPKTQNCGQSTNYELRGSQTGSKSTTYSQTTGQRNHQYNANNFGYGQYTGQTRHDSNRGETGYQCKGPNCARPIPNYENIATSTEYVGCNLQTMECSRPRQESTQNQYEYQIPTDYRHEGQLLKVYKVGQKYGQTYPNSWQGNEYLGNGHGELNRHNCNPNIQNCGQYTSQSTTVTQFSNGPQQRPNYGRVCNVNDPNCRQNQYNNQQTNIQKTTTISQPICPSGFVGLHKHPTECKKYLNCANGQTFVMDCGPGTVFNPKSSVCDYPYNVDCTDSETSHVTTSENSGRYTGQGRVEDNTGSYSEWHNQNENNWQDLHHDSGHGNNYATHKPYPSENYNQKNKWDNDNQHIVTGETRGKPGYVIKPVDRSPDYEDVHNSNYHHQQKPQASTPRSAWPPPYQTSDSNDIGETDYIFTYDNGEPIVLEPENVIEVKQRVIKKCSDEDFHCSANSCISLALLCDNNRDCPDGKDELNCREYIERFSVAKNSRLVVVENQRYVNVSHSTCAVLCIQNKKFTCRSFTYRRPDRSCFLSDKNIGLSGALHSYQFTDYYELKAGAIDCSDKRKYFECNNKKCLTKDYVCDGYNDCDEREDEKHCGAEKFGYKIKLAGSDQKNEGRVEVTAFGSSGYICDDDFSIVDANVVCKELGFPLGAAEVKGQSYFAKDLKEKNTLYMIDDLNCVGNESTVIDCSFPGWGMHNCRDQEIAGVVCKTPQEKCGDDKWKCDSGNECVPFEFVCDGIEDCYDDSDEAVQHCEAPTELRLVGGSHAGEGRVEIKHNNIWGTICDDDFNEDAAKVVCKILGFKGKSFVKKDGYFGAGSGPIWLDQVSCYGNETELNTCTHWDWGEHNCEHSEDVGVICSQDIEDNQLERHSNLPTRIEEGLPQNCGLRKDNQFAIKDLIQARVIGGGIAKQGDYPWQAALKVRVKDKSAHWCGAIIISSRWVLTAAHCLQGYTKGAYVIVAGDYNTDDAEGTEQQKYIDEFFVHEQFRKGHKLNNDVALIKVKGTGFILNDHVQPICLADASTDYSKQMNCTISGFGSVKSGVSAYSHNLLSAWITTYSDDICRMPHVYGDVLTDGMFCAGSMDGGMDACDGDSGGPLACLDQGVFTLYGITSWGMHCGYANKPGVYVKVGHYKKWIEDTIAKHSR